MRCDGILLEINIMSEKDQLCHFGNWTSCGLMKNSPYTAEFFPGRKFVY